MGLMRRMLPIRLMPQAANQGASIEIVVDFDTSIQSLGSLEAAAYRLIGTATCQIDRVADRFACRLTTPAVRQKHDRLSSDDLKVRFLNLVADENLRSRISEKTEGIRNVILALAFGSLAANQNDVE
jgi:His-Xaa-Ser system protein HxsD